MLPKNNSASESKQKGLVVKSTGSGYLVRLPDGKRVYCSLRGKIRLGFSRSTNPVVVGDKVDLEVSADEINGVITGVDERKNYIVRRSTNLSRHTHIIAANIDQALLVVTMAFPETATEFIDRFLVTAEAYRIPSVLVFNKTDLYPPELIEDMDELIRMYSDIGYRCIQTSVVNGTGIDELAMILHGKTSLVSGNSGVGKSSLINKLEPGLNLRTEIISDAHHKGKHTTTFSEIFELNSGAFIIDTPGIKGFGLVDINKEELFHFFPEFFRLVNKCQYYNCTHVHEPNCAVKQGMNDGIIHPLRYRSYLGMLLGDDDKHRRG